MRLLYKESPANMRMIRLIKHFIKINSMKRSVLLAGIAAGFLFACQDNSINEKQDTMMMMDHHQEENANPVQLNNGEKWEANPETTEQIKKMIALTDTFPALPVAADYSALKVKLETEFQLVFQKCTMTGEAHTQLHNYLIPLKGMIEELGSDNLAAAAQAFDRARPTPRRRSGPSASSSMT